MSDKCPTCGSPTTRSLYSANTEWQATPNSLVQIGKLTYGGGGGGGLPNGGTTYVDFPEP